MGRHNPDDENSSRPLGWGNAPAPPDEAQGNLFAPMQARSTDPHTSHEAARSLDPASLSRIKKSLLAVYEANPDGLTAREAGRLVGHAEAWKRCSDLIRDGFLAPTGETRKDPDTKRAGRVLVLA